MEDQLEFCSFCGQELPLGKTVACRAPDCAEKLSQQTLGLEGGIPSEHQLGTEGLPLFDGAKSS